MRGTPNGTQDDLSGKRAPGAAPRPRVTSQTCVPFAKGRNRAIGNLSRLAVLTGARRFTCQCFANATQDEQTCVRALRGDNVRWVDGWPYRVYADGYVQIGTGAKGSMFPRFSVRLTSCTACPCIELTDLTPRPRSISPILESVILPGSLLSPY